jgi:multiple RNA-binding domain-containing protein 1
VPPVLVQTIADSRVGHDDGNIVPDDAASEDAKAPAPDDQDPVTDADWLRSRTNRVLDFVEDDQVPLSAKPSSSKAVVDREASLKAIAMPTVPQQPDNEPPQTAAAPPSETDKIRDTGRLFLRNLHFDVTEDDLREHFSQYGALEEVRDFLPFLSAHSPYDEYPNRDSRCLANAVNRERILVDVSLI